MISRSRFTPAPFLRHCISPGRFFPTSRRLTGDVLNGNTLADVVTDEAGAAIVFDVVGTAEIADVLVLRVGVIPKLTAAVRTATLNKFYHLEL